MTDVVVLDIEGTTSPTASVHDVLFGYTRERMADWVAGHRSGVGEQILEEARRYAGRPTGTEQELVELMREWLDTNVKCEPLKTLQGLICAEGFRAGRLHGEFFPDVAPALKRWRAAGIRLYAYSSGSERNQRDWFTFARSGGLDHLLHGYFDLTSAGNKRVESSYERIAEAVRAAPEDIVFLTDSPPELDAAATAGWSVFGVVRAGEPQRAVPPHTWVSTFDEVDLRYPARASPAQESWRGGVG